MFERSDDTAVPVLLITGFLGSGKTTLLNAFISRLGREGTALVINEFGEMPLDQHFVEAGSARTVVLANGCLCCVASQDFETGLGQVYALDSATDGAKLKRVLIETSGLADPGPVMQLLIGNPLYSRLYRLASVVCTVDATREGQFTRFPEAVKQVALADHIILTKGDIAAPGRREAVIAELASINPTASVHEATFGAIAPELVLRPAQSAPQRRTLPPGMAHAEHTHGVRSFVLTIDEPIDWPDFARWFRRLRIDLGDRLLRAKGIIFVRGEDQPLAIHSVGHVFHPPVRLQRGSSPERRSHLVFIVQNVERAVIEDSWRAHGGGRGEPHIAALT